MNMGAKIKFIREHHNLSPEQMSEKLNISLPTYRRLESGERPPKVDELKLICDEFDVDLDYFLNQSAPIFQKNAKHANGYINSHVVNVDKDILDSLRQSLNALVKILDKK